MSTAAAAQLARSAVSRLVGRGPVVCLTGAGMSTASGIPDYRSPGRPPYKPLQHRDFVKHKAVRQRYWARSAVGYGQVHAAEPNDAHHAVAAMGLPVVTQNVDSLHHKAGSGDVVELHGSLRNVECMECGHVLSRLEMQEQLLARNRKWIEREMASDAVVRPDGDRETADYSNFDVPSCDGCGADALKPSVVFFGDNLRPSVADLSRSRVADAGALLVLGTSLSVWSAFRLVRQAVEKQDIPVVVVTRGPTRADQLATLKVDEHSLSDFVPLMAEEWARIHG